MDAGVAAFADDVRTRRYPAPEHTYSIPDEELELFRATGTLEGHLASWEGLEGFYAAIAGSRKTVAIRQT
jgi:hypothetical protein